MAIVHELWWTTGDVDVVHRDLTGPSGFPRAAGDPAAYVTADGTQHVIYRGGDGNVHELRWDPSKTAQGMFHR